MAYRFNPFTNRLDYYDPSSGGDVVGPGASVAGDIAIFADASGTLLADSGIGTFATYLVGCAGIVDSLTPTVNLSVSPGQFTMYADNLVSLNVGLTGSLTFTPTLMTVNNAVAITKSFGLGVTSVFATPYVVVDGTDFCLEVTITPCTVQLPNAPPVGTIFVIKDTSGSATPAITVTTVGGVVTIDGVVSQSITSQNGAMSAQFDGGSYIILSSKGAVGIPIIGTSTANALVRWSGVAGAAVLNGVVTEDNTGNLSQSTAVSGASLSMITANTSNTASATAYHKVQVAGATASDAYFQSEISGGQAWTWGLDNSDSDAFAISQGSALGTNNVMRVSVDGEINYPLQPNFLAYLAADVTNVTGNGTNYTIIFDTEVYDQNADFNLGTSTFTAPVTGRFQFNMFARFENLASGNTLGYIELVTSNRTYRLLEINTGLAQISGQCGVFGSTLADMDSGDTATVRVNVAGGAQIVGVGGSATVITAFSGFLTS